MGEADEAAEIPAANEEEESMEGDDQSSDDAGAVDLDAPDADASEVEAPAEDDAEPIEDTADNGNEAEESGSSDLGMEIMRERTNFLMFSITKSKLPLPFLVFLIAS